MNLKKANQIDEKKIIKIKEHLKNNKKDIPAKRALLKKIAKQKKIIRLYETKK